MGEKITFWVCAVIVLGGALFTITRRNTVTAVMSLVGTFFGLAALYTLLSAHFLAAIQVLVYAGAIMTLFVFVVMVLNREEADPWAIRGFFTKVILGLAVTGYLTARVVIYLGRVPDGTKSLPPTEFGSVSQIGDLLFGGYLFPFEAVSLLLLVAVIGAVVVARIPRKPADEAHAPAPVEEKHG